MMKGHGRMMQEWPQFISETWAPAVCFLWGPRTIPGRHGWRTDTAGDDSDMEDTSPAMSRWVRTKTFPGFLPKRSMSLWTPALHTVTWPASSTGDCHPHSGVPTHCSTAGAQRSTLIMQKLDGVLHQPHLRDSVTGRRCPLLSSLQILYHTVVINSHPPLQRSQRILLAQNSGRQCCEQEVFSKPFK